MNRLKFAVQAGMLCFNISAMAADLKLDASPIRSKDSQTKLVKTQEARLNSINLALSESLSDRSQSENRYEKNAGAGRPKRVKTESARVQLELGDELGGWAYKRTPTQSKKKSAPKSDEAIKRIEEKLDRESKAAHQGL